MLDIVREGRDYLTGELGLKSRLAARVGVLMASRIACTRGVLEEVESFPVLATLLLSSELKSAGNSLDVILPELLQREAYAALGEELSLQVVSVEDWQVIALGEEVEAEAGFAAVSAHGRDDGTDDRNALLVPQGAPPPSLIPQGAEGGGVEAAFSPEKIAELRVSIFAGETSAERVSALRRLAFSPLPSEELGGIFLQALGEGDGALRSAAAAALRKNGLQGEVAESIRLLAEGEEGERCYSCQRLGSGALSGSVLEVQAALMALLGSIRSDTNEEVLETAIVTLAKVAPHSPCFRDSQVEVMQLLLEQVLSGSERLQASVRTALRAFEEAAPGTVGPYLLAEADQTEVITVGAYLLTVASSCAFSDEEGERMKQAAARCLLRLPAEAQESHILGAYLMDLGDEGIREVLEQTSGASVGHLRFLVHLFDNALRFRELSDEIQIGLGALALRLLESGSRQLCHDLFDTRLITVEALSSEARVAMAKALLQSVRDFTLESAHRSVENALVKLGVGITEPLLALVSERAGTLEGRISCRALGRIALENRTTAALDAAAWEDALRVLQRLTFTSERMRNEVFVTMGQVCATGHISEDASGLIVQGLLNRIQGSAEDAPIFRALGWQICSPKAPLSLLRQVGGLAMAHLEEEAAETRIESCFEQGEEIFSFSGAFDVHSELIPACLEVMEHLLIESALPVNERTGYLDRLLHRWRDCAAFKVHWSPGNAVRLSSLLGRVAEGPELDEESRSKIIHTLCAKMGDIPVLESLGGILATGLGGNELDRLAAAVSTRLLGYLETERDLTTEDRELYLRVLGQVAKRGRFEVRGGGGDRLLCRVIGEISRGVRDRIPGALQILTALSASSSHSEEVAQCIEKELSLYTQVALHA
ncbi:MAG: hypothetical protein ACYTGH_01995 [Planctomycetota bacterium]|jgi:hypothetical protein